jgi:hypothetical protein
MLQLFLQPGLYVATLQYTCIKMLVTISEAARQTDAPSHQAIFRMTKKNPLPAFLVPTEKGWRVDTDNAAWKVYLSGVSRRSMPQKLGGNETKRIVNAAHERNAEGPTPQEEANPELEALAVRHHSSKIIWDAQLTRQKLEQAEIKTNAMKELFVEKAEAEYWFSFIQRGINDSFASVKRSFPELKRLILAGDDLRAEKYLTGSLKRGFEMAVEAARETIKGADGGE